MKVLTATLLFLAPVISFADKTCEQTFQESTTALQLFRDYPKLSEKIRHIDDFISQKQKEVYFAGTSYQINSYEWIKVESKIESKKNQMTPRDYEAAHEVVKAIYNIENWKSYTKQLYFEAARWIDQKGSPIEKARLLDSGKISRRSVLVVLTARARARGETVGKIDKVLTDEEFALIAARGPFIDKAFRETSDHGQLPHFIQMDYVAPTLQKFYEKDVGPFYIAVFKADLWHALFDKYQRSFGSPLGITEVLGEVIPLVREKDVP